MVTGFTFAFDSSTHGSIQHVCSCCFLLLVRLGSLTVRVQFALEVANPQPYVFVARFMVTTSTGALQVWQQDVIQWTREESLSELQNVEFIDLPEKKVAEDVLDGHNFITRLLRQIGDAKVGFPSTPAYNTLTSHSGLSNVCSRFRSSVFDRFFCCVRKRLRQR